MPRFDRVERIEDVVEVEERNARARDASTRKRGRGRRKVRNLLRQETVPMTVLAQDPIVVGVDGPVFAQVAVPAERLQRGPRGHRFHVVDIGVGTNAAQAPVQLTDGDPWVYRDRWDADSRDADPSVVVEDRKFRAQNVYAVAAHTLALFQQHLGRPIPWNSSSPQLYLIPHARVEANAFYSREHNAVLFGWLPAIGDHASLYTCLSFDVIAHEVSHAILDGLRPRYTEPGLPDQLAFHEALADLVALLSLFAVKGVAQNLLDDGTGKIVFPTDRDALAIADADERRRALAEGRAAVLKASPLTALAEQIGGRRAKRHAPEGTMTGRYPALRRSVALAPTTTWVDDPAYQEPHRRAEILVAAFMRTLVSMWADRLDPLRVDGDGIDVGRVAEEGIKSARHLLAMLLRALDYLPPVELEFADVIDSVVTADQRLAPDDEHGYRATLLEAFAAFGITPPPHRIVDQDGMAAPEREDDDQEGRVPRQPPATMVSPFGPDPDARPAIGIRYEHLNLAALRTSPEEIYQFIWNNGGALEIDVRLTTRVERVLSSTRTGPDGLVVHEIIADYLQSIQALPDDLPPGITAPDEMPRDKPVELLGGGVLVFDQFGRYRLHQRKPVCDVDRQNRRLVYLHSHDIRDRFGGLGTSDGQGDKRRFALLHRDSDPDEL